MKKTVLLFLFTVLLFSFKHPHYLSVTDLKYSKQEKRLQGFVKIFTHDFENTLKKIHKKPIDLINPTDTSVTRKLIGQYLLSHLIVTADEKKLDFKVIGFENENESVYIYIESGKCGPPKYVRIQNSLLYEAYKEQSNIVHLEVNGQNKSQKVTNPAKDLSFHF